MLGKKHAPPPESWKLNLSKSHKGKIPWNKNKKNPYSEETLLQMSNAKKGKTTWNKGIPMNEIAKLKLRETIKRNKSK